MSGLIEYFAGFDIFPLGWFSWVYTICFLFVFVYLGIRATEPKARDKALEITGGTAFVALLVAFTNLPSFWSGVILVFGLVISKQLVLKWNKRDVITSFISLWVLLLIWGFVPFEYGYPFSAFGLFYFYLVSEFDIRNKKKKEAAKADKPKK